MGIPYNYRNKAGYPVVDGKIGFYRDRSHSLIENKECAIQNQEADKIARIAFEVIKKNGVPSYNEKTNKGVLRHIVTRIGKNTGETMLMLVTNGTDLKIKKNSKRNSRKISTNNNNSTKHKQRKRQCNTRRKMHNTIWKGLYRG